jgi:hypothetical protein
MKRPLALLATTVLAALAAVVPAASASAADYGFTAQAKWVNDTISVVYSWNGLPMDALSGDLAIRVGGSAGAHAAVSDDVARTSRVSTLAWGSGHGTTAKLTATVEVCDATTDPASGTSTEASCTTRTVWTRTVSRHVVKRKAGQVSAATLLGKLKVATETHASSYARSKFKLWLDADHDGENTRAEVLKIETKKRVTENASHTVETGKWVSPYDGKTVASAAKLDIDHLVPLEEAWTSGASSWSANRRSAYANDLGYAASLVAVSLHENRSKGDEEPNAYLPPKASYVCTYVRNWIAVKYRWALKVDAVEKAALRTDLATSCTNPNVTKPGKPDIRALVGAKTSSGGSSGGGSSSGGGGTTTGLDPRYATCTELLKHPNHAPYQRGVDPEYAWYQDRDGDGLVCE